jgi:hypothetical protein
MQEKELPKQDLKWFLFCIQDLEAYEVILTTDFRKREIT